MPKKAVLFDLDGTLLNSIPDIAACMNRVLGDMGLPTYSPEKYCYMTGNGAKKLCERAAGARQDLVEEILSRYSTLYAAHCFDGSHLYPGIPEMMTALKAAGYRLAVVSNKDDGDVQTVIRHYFPMSPFDITRGRLPGVPLKPDPTAILQVAREMGIDPDDFWYMGDTPTDMAACKGAGMHFVAVSYGFRTVEELLSAGAAQTFDSPAAALAHMLS